MDTSVSVPCASRLHSDSPLYLPHVCAHVSLSTSVPRGLCFLSRPATVAYPVATGSKLRAARWRTTRGDSVPYLRLALNVGPRSSPGVSGVSLCRLQTRSARIRAMLAVANHPRKATPTSRRFERGFNQSLSLCSCARWDSRSDSA
jgi:hypothetical protein